MTVLLPVRPTHNGVFIDIIDRNVTQKNLGNGKVLHLLGDDDFGIHNSVTGGQHPGVRPRWARVLGIGPDVDEVEVGDLVLCDTLKWGRKIPLGRIGLEVIYFWHIAVDDILLIDARLDDRSVYIEQAQNQIARVEFGIGKGL